MKENLIKEMKESFSTFEKAREDYLLQRGIQRKIIVKLLKGDDYSVTDGGTAGSGLKNYKSNFNKLDPPHDLRHHKWVEAEKDGIGFLISLNPVDTDPGSGNIHHLYDRIGVQAYIEENTEKSMRTSMMITPLSLPMDEEKCEELLKIVERLRKTLVYHRDTEI